MRVTAPGFPRSASPMLGGTLVAIPRSRSCGRIRPHKQQPPPLPATLRRCCSASYDQHHFHPHNFSVPPPPPRHPPPSKTRFWAANNADLLQPSVLGIRPEPPEWPARDEVIRATIARRASSVDLPLSLRILKKKNKKQRIGDDIGVELGGGEVDPCPAKKAFASAVYAIREIHSQALRMREAALGEELDTVIGKVQSEMNSSFVWLFREVFSRTPDLMVDVMVIMADYAVYSTKNLTSTAMMTIPSLSSKGMNLIPVVEVSGLVVKEIENLDRLIRYPRIVPREISLAPIKESEEVMDREEMELWDSMVDEAYRMQETEMSVVGLDRGAMQQFVSPVSVVIEDDHYVEYSKTDLFYQIGLAQEPNNPLLLSNYAQFLYLVARDYDRAEECFQRAIQSYQTDAEILSQYATFLWLIKKDIWRAEERYQQAVAAEPDNPYHASKYANFLWCTGGDDTCYPIELPHGKN